MKSFKLFLGLLIVFFVFMVSCNRKESELKKENEQLRIKLSEMEKINKDLNSKIIAVESQINKLKETPEEMFNEATGYKQKEDYKNAINILEKLIIKAEGKPLAKRALSEIGEIKKLQHEKSLAEEKAKRDVFQDVGGGFSVRKVRFISSMGMTEVVGEMKNSSGQNYTIANFIIALYDSGGNLLGNAVANISNFNTGTIKSFSAYSEISTTAIAKYRVQFENAM